MNERLRKLRKSLDMTQQNFGARISVKGNTVAQWESGRNEPSDSAISLICREFNVNEDWLRTGNGEMFVKDSSDEEFMKVAKAVASGNTEADQAIRKVLIDFYQMDDLGRQTLINFVRFLSENERARVGKASSQFPKTPEDLEAKYPPEEDKAKRSS
jgi:HTH-type transcriptional regulator/antitoxin PezA